jgi:hypothetical protein
MDIQRLDLWETNRALAHLGEYGGPTAGADALPLLARARELLDAGAQAGAHVRAGDVAFLAHNIGKIRTVRTEVAQTWESIVAWSVPSSHAFSAKQLVMLVRALRGAPKMPTRTRPLLEAIAVQAVQRACELEPRTLATLAHSYAKAHIAVPANFWQAIAQQAQLLIADFNAQDISNTAWAFATAGVPAPELFAAIAAHAQPRLAEFKAQELSNTAWAFATAGVPAPELFAAIAAHARPRIAEFKAQELSNTAWAFATAAAPASELFAAIAARARPRLADFTTQGLSNTAWAFATAGIPEHELFASIARHALPRLADFTPQGLPNTAWAFATAGVPAPELFVAFAAHARPHLAKFNAQELSNTAWAFATAGAHAPELFAAIAAHAQPRLAQFNAQGLSNTALAFATAGVQAPKLFNAIAAHARPRLAEFTPQGLSNTAWAFATAGVRAPEVVALIAAHAQPRLADFTAQDFSNTAWACATARMPAPKLLAAIAAHARPRLAEFSAQNLSNTAWAFATAAAPAPELFAAIAARARPRLAEFKAQELSNTAWALAVGRLLDAQPIALHSPLIFGTVLSLAERYLQDHALHAERTKAGLHGVELALLICHVLTADLGQAEQETERLHQLRGRAREMAGAFGQRAPLTAAAGQRELSRRLRAAGWEHELEAWLEGDLLVVDMACTRTRVVVEYDGSSHYLFDVDTGERRYDGNTLGKTKLLEALGWRVHRVGWREWRANRERVVRELAPALCTGPQPADAG